MKFPDLNAVYMRINKDYTASVIPLSKLTTRVATAVGVDESGIPLSINGTICKKHLRNYIVAKLNRELADFDEVQSNESINHTFSVKQYKKLMNISQDADGNKCITAYIFVLIYYTLKIYYDAIGIYDMMPVEYNNFAEGYRKIISDYYDNHQSYLADFALSCDSLITYKLDNGIYAIPPEDFPSIPRKHIRDSDE